MLLWGGIALGLDAIVGLAGARYWERRFPRIPIGRIATVEAVVAAAMLIAFLKLAR